MSNIKENAPVSLTITMKDAERAVEYWLSNVVFKDDVNIDSVHWMDSGRLFRVDIDRSVQDE